jgi:hypothetical protein
MEVFQSSLDPEDISELFQEICIPLNVQDETVDWYNKAIAHALEDYCSYIATGYSYRTCVMGRYLLRTATLDDEVDMLLVVKSIPGLDVEGVVLSELNLSQKLTFLDNKEDGFRLKMANPVQIDGVALQPQVRIRLLIVPAQMFTLSVEVVRWAN